MLEMNGTLEMIQCRVSQPQHYWNFLDWIILCLLEWGG